MKRIVESEWLDVLPAEDLRAQHSRRDLRRINSLMGHVSAMSWMLRSALKSHSFQNPIRIMELGAGDGTFAWRLARQLKDILPKVELMLVDFKPVVTSETCAQFETLGWKAKPVAADVFDWLQDSASRDTDIIIANLFLHQFDGPQLARMLPLCAERTRLLAACEPRRARLPFAFSRMLGLIGCNDVTRHDAPISVSAGFTGDEISALWPSDEGWRLKENAKGLFSHAFMAAKEREGPRA